MSFTRNLKLLALAFALLAGFAQIRHASSSFNWIVSNVAAWLLLTWLSYQIAKVILLHVASRNKISPFNKAVLVTGKFLDRLKGVRVRVKDGEPGELILIKSYYIALRNRINRNIECAGICTTINSYIIICHQMDANTCLCRIKNISWYSRTAVGATWRTCTW